MRAVAMSLLSYLGWNIAEWIFGTLALGALYWMFTTTDRASFVLGFFGLVVFAMLTIFTMLRLRHRS